MLDESLAKKQNKETRARPRSAAAATTRRECATRAPPARLPLRVHSSAGSNSCRHPSHLAGHPKPRARPETSPFGAGRAISPETQLSALALAGEERPSERQTYRYLLCALLPAAPSANLPAGQFASAPKLARGKVYLLSGHLRRRRGLATLLGCQ